MKWADTKSKVAGLREKMAVALNTADIATLRLSIRQMMTSGTSTVFRNILPPPSLSPFFVGRKEERRKLLSYWSGMEAVVLLSTAGQGRHN